MRHVHKLGVQSEPMSYTLVPCCGSDGRPFPELNRALPLVTETLKRRRSASSETLDRGLRCSRRRRRLGEAGTLPGEVAFKLYDTYGFPLDLTRDALPGEGAGWTSAGFDAAWKNSAARPARPGPARASRPTDGLVRHQGPVRRDRVPGLRHRRGEGRTPGPGQGRPSRSKSPKAKAASWCLTRPRSTANPAARSAIPATIVFESRRDGARVDTCRRRSATCTSTGRGGARHADGGRGGAAWRSTASGGPGCAPTTPPPTCCTRRCADVWAST